LDQGTDQVRFYPGQRLSIANHPVNDLDWSDCRLLRIRVLSR
jgi:hypothetical protein